MKKGVCTSICLIALVIVLLTTAISCKGSNDGGYSKFEVKKDLASFSFEYPSSFLEPRVDRTNEPSYIRVSTLGGPPLPERGIEFLTISVISVSDSYPNSSAMLERQLKDYRELSDFRLLDRFPITVSGSRGELIAFSYGGFTPVDPLDEPRTGTAYISYFDHGGFIWKIDLTTDEHAMTQAKTHLDHILKTFKFLD